MQKTITGEEIVGGGGEEGEYLARSSFECKIRVWINIMNYCVLLSPRPAVGCSVLQGKCKRQSLELSVPLDDGCFIICSLTSGGGLKLCMVVKC